MKKKEQYLLIHQFISTEKSVDGIKSLSYNTPKTFALLLEGAKNFKRKEETLKIEELKIDDTILLKDTDKGYRRILKVKKILKTLNEEYVITCSITGYNGDREFGEDKFMKILETQNIH